MKGPIWLKQLSFIPAAGAMAMLFVVTARAHTEPQDEMQAIRIELQSLQQEQSALRQELTEIKKLLLSHKQPGTAEVKAEKPSAEPPLPMEMPIGESPFLGDQNAPVVLFEFTDYHCPFCRQHVEQTYPRLVKEYVDTGKLKIVLKEFPIQKLHPQAARAAMAAQCAGGQNQYWPMHDLLFQNQARTSMEDMASFASSLQLDKTRFLDCMEQGQYAAQIRADFELGVSAGVRGTPFFYIGPQDSNTPGMITVASYLYGAHSYETFAQVIDSYLNKEQVSD